MKQRLIAFFVWCFYSLLRLTWRVSFVEPPQLKKNLTEGNPFILSHWHGDEMVLVFTAKRYRILTIVSQSQDGEIMNTFFKLNGGFTVRGSSSKGGAHALRSLVTQVKKKNLNVSFAVDGPKGPLHEVKPGVFQFQRLLKPHPTLYAAGISVDRFWCFKKSWNKTILPKPFAQVVIYWLETSLVTTTELDPRDQTLAQNLKDALFQSRNNAQKILFSPDA
jgi:lysophospholipid acyltransferase (LPLAT)-like uncharacterized protein